MAEIDLTARETISAAANAAAAALGKLVDQADLASAATTKLGESTSRAGPGFESLSRKLDEQAGLAAKVASINAAYERTLATLRAEAERSADAAARLNQLEAAAAADRDLAIQKATRAADALTAQRAAVESLTTAQAQAIQRTQQQAAASQQAASAQAAYNAQLGVRTDTGQDTANRAADIQAYAAALQNETEKYLPLLAVERQHQEALAAIANLQKTGGFDADQAGAAVARQTALYKVQTETFGAHADGANKSAYATRQLGIQAVQSISGLATGQSALMVLLQQGHQVVDSVLSQGGGLASLGDAAKGLFNALGGWTTLGLVAFSGILYEIVGRASSLQHEATETGLALKGFGLSTDVSVGSVKALSSSLREAGVDAKTTHDLLIALNGTSLNSQQRTTAVQTGRDLTAVNGQDLVTNVKVVTSIQQGDIDAVKKLDDTMNFLTVDERKQIQAAQDLGNIQQAVSLAMTALQDRTKGFADAGLTPVQKAVNGLQAAWDAWMDSIATAPIITNILNAIGAVGQEIAKHIKAAPASGQASQLGSAAPFVGIDGIEGVATPGVNVAAEQQAAATKAAEDLGAADAKARQIQEDADASRNKALELQQKYVDGLIASIGKKGELEVAAIGNSLLEKANMDTIAEIGNRIVDADQRRAILQANITREVNNQIAKYGELVKASDLAADSAARSAGQVPGGTTIDSETGTRVTNMKSAVQIAVEKKMGEMDDIFAQTMRDWRKNNRDVPLDPDTNLPMSAEFLRLQESQQQAKAHERENIEKTMAANNLNRTLTDNRGVADQAEVLRAKPAARSVVQARLAGQQQLIDSGQATVDENGHFVMGPNQREAEVGLAGKIANAQASASTGDVQSIQATDRQIVAAQKLSAAAKISTQAVEQQTIANEAADRVANTYSLSLAVETERLTKKAAAEATSVLAQQNTISQQTLSQNQEAVDSTSVQGDHTAALDIKVQQLTQHTRDLANLRSGPDKAAMLAEIANTERLAQLTEKQTNDISNNQQAHQTQQQIEYLQKTVELSGLAADQQAEGLARFKTLQELESKQSADPMHLTETQQHLIDVNGELAKGTALVDKQKAAAKELTDAFGTAFDQVGQSITQAFTQGNAAAISFGSIAKGVISSLVSEFVKLAIVNPLSNAVFNSDKNTLLDAFNGLSSGGGGGSNLNSGGGGGGGGATGTTTSGSGRFSTLGNLGSGASSLSSAFGGPSFSSALSSAGNYLGLTNGAGSFTAPGSFLGQSTSIGATQAITVDGSTVMAGGQTMGAALASGAAGFTGGVALGSLVGTGEQHLLNKTGPAPTIGAAGGAALMIGAAALAPETLGLSLLAAGLIGGTAGGALGGLIGPRPQSTYSTTALDLTKGTLQVGQTHAQNVDAKAQVDFLQQQVDQLNKFVMDNKISITGQNAPIQIGANNPGGFQDPTKYADLNTANVTGATAFSHYTFSATDPIENDKLKDKTFANETDFGTWVDNFNTIQASAKSYLTGTAAIMKQAGAVTGSFNDSMANINKTFDDADTSAKTMLSSDKLSEQQTKDVTKAENDLAGVRAKLTKQTIDQKNAQIQSGSDTLMAGILSDRAQLQRNPGLSAKMTVDAQLFAFDKQVPVLKQQFDDGWKQIFGDDFASMKEYQDQLKLFEEKSYDDRLVIAEQYNKQIEDQQKQLAKNVFGITARYLSAKGANDNNPAEVLQGQFVSYDAQAAQEREDMITAYTTAGESADALAKAMDGLTKTQEEERKQIQNAFDDKLRQTATGSIVALTQYAQKLESGSNSPLSPTAQLDSARTKFDQQRALALGGDSTALNNLSSYSDSFLAASKSVYGSGSQYATDFSKVLDTLTTISTTSPDTLTASVLATETRTQTQVLQDSLQALKDELVAIKLELKVGATTPSQLAA